MPGLRQYFRTVQSQRQHAVRCVRVKRCGAYLPMGQAGFGAFSCLGKARCQSAFGGSGWFGVAVVCLKPYGKVQDHTSS